MEDVKTEEAPPSWGLEMEKDEEDAEAAQWGEVELDDARDRESTGVIDDDVEEGGDTPGLVVCSRSLLVAAALLTWLAAALNLASTPGVPRVMISIYLAMFALLLCCFEVRPQRLATTIATDCGFLYSAHARFLFLVLVCTLCFGLGVAGYLAMAVLMAAACTGSCAACLYPGYESRRRRTDSREPAADTPVVVVQIETPNPLVGLTWAQQQQHRDHHDRDDNKEQHDDNENPSWADPTMMHREVQATADV